MSLKDILKELERTYNVNFQISSSLLETELFNSDLYTIKFMQRDEITYIMDIVTKTVGNISFKLEDELQTILIYSHKKKGDR